MSLYELAGLEGPAGLKEKKPSTPAAAPAAASVLAAAWSGAAGPPEPAAGRRKPALAPAVGFKPMALSKKTAGACTGNGGGAAAGSQGAGAAAAAGASSGAVGGPVVAGGCHSPAGTDMMGVRGWYVDIKVPYDPGEPNEFEDWAREAEAKRKAAAIEEALRKKQAILATAQSVAAAALEGGARKPPPPPPLPPPSGPAAAPPAPAPAAPPPVPGFADESGDPGLAMMRAMGWKEGKGLGSCGQGMTTPLIARKTTCVSAVIVNAEERPRKPPPPPPLPTPPPAAALGVGGAAGGGGGERKGSVTFRGRPSRVLLLKNMVAPGEVDDDLRGEIGEECSRFGEVVDVVVRELPPEIESDTEAGGEAGGPVQRLSEDERVRIFVKFAKQASAMKAYIELDGRYFGGRNVWVCFFREMDFDAGSFAPSAREPK